MYKNEEDKKEYMRKYYLKNKKCLKEKHKKYYESNRDYLLEKQKEYIIENSDSIKEYMKNYSVKNKEKKSEYNKNYWEENKDKLYVNQKDYIKFKLYNDTLYKLKWNIKTLIKYSFRSKSIKKSSKTEDILGCSFDEFKLYLESKFEDWMTWENRGLYNGDFKYGWDIDHIIPISSAKTEEDIIKLNHYTNLQPLCSHVNRNIKRNRIDK